MRTIYPVFRYADPRAAIAFLVEAFGFDVREVSEGPDGTVRHAELTFDTGMIMVGQAAEPGRGRPTADAWRVYVAVDDVDGHHNRAKAAGAEIVQPLTDQPYGSREYGARDSEGNAWSFGTYRP
ncbi:MAG TPA: VOC family protein [Asanoa sp.]